jgi:hypothetical protein
MAPETTRRKATNSRNEPQTTIEVVDPKTAREWLGHNTKNRSVKTTKVVQFSRDMVEGKWQLDGSAIRFAKDGTLLDGQNRLHACIDSNLAFKTFVIRGLEPETQQVMDSGAPRTAADALKMRGYDNSNNLQAVIGCHAWWRYGLYKHCMNQPASRDRLTNTEMVEHVIEFPGLVDATRMGGMVKRVAYLPIGAVGCAIHETSLVDADASEEFFQRIAQFETHGPTDPVSVLLRRVSAMRERREVMLPATGLYLIFRAWNAIRDGEELSRYILGSDEKGWAAIPDPH